jgi:hypothetical protein
VGVKYPFRKFSQNVTHFFIFYSAAKLSLPSHSMLREHVPAEDPTVVSMCAYVCARVCVRVRVCACGRRQTYALSSLMCVGEGGKEEGGLLIFDRINRP